MAEGGPRDAISKKPMYFLCQRKQRIITKIRPSFAGFLNADHRMRLTVLLI
jgi:hypothetical protein